jgi:hypothetical protein
VAGFRDSGSIFWSTEIKGTWILQANHFCISKAEIGSLIFYFKPLILAVSRTREVIDAAFFWLMIC